MLDMNYMHMHVFTHVYRRNDMAMEYGSENQAPQAPKLTVDDVTLGAILGEGWEAYKANFGMIFVGFLVYLVIAAILGNIPLVPIFVLPHIMVGYYIMCLRAVRNQPVELGDLFKGFSLYVPILLANILIGLGVLVGMLLLIVPGIILALMWAQTFFLLSDDVMEIEDGAKNKDQVAAYDTMKASADLMKGWKLKVFVYGIVIGLVVVSGLILLGVGVLFTAPLGMMAFASLYNRIRQIGPIG